MPDDIIRDKIIFGIVDNKISDSILREPDLNLDEALYICRTAEISKVQIKAVDDLNWVNVHLVKAWKQKRRPPTTPAKKLRYPGWFWEGKNWRKTRTLSLVQEVQQVRKGYTFLTEMQLEF